MSEAHDLVGPRPRSVLSGRAGLMPRQDIRDLVRRNFLRATEPLRESQFQPASLDLRVGKRAWRVRASFLPGRGASVEDKLQALRAEELDLGACDGAIFERGCVYLVELLEFLELPELVSAIANPKSSTGRLDVFTRLITDHSEVFDAVESGYQGRLFAEVSPRSFSIKLRKGTRLNQIRFRRRNSQQQEISDFRLPDSRLRELHRETPLVEGELSLRHGLVLRIELGETGSAPLIGYRAQRHADLVDVDRVGAYATGDYWEPIRARDDRRLILDPNEFYILVSKERLQIPPHLAAEMVPIDPSMGEFRVHYAGFFDPGFGRSDSGRPGSRAVLEVRSHEVPFVLEDGQMVCRLAYERMAEEPDVLYGAIGTSNYQGQDLKLSKQFRA